jgi:hypothetical protein
MSGYDNEYRCEECNSYVCECGIEDIKHPKEPEVIIKNNILKRLKSLYWTCGEVLSSKSFFISFYSVFAIICLWFVYISKGVDINNGEAMYLNATDYCLVKVDQNIPVQDMHANLEECLKLQEQDQLAQR